MGTPTCVQLSAIDCATSSYDENVEIVRVDDFDACLSDPRVFFANAKSVSYFFSLSVNAQDVFAIGDTARSPGSGGI